MKFIAHITVMPLKELLDPQGKTIAKNMSHVDIQGVEDVRIGKTIEMTLNAKDESEARAKVEKACNALLANPIMESYEFEIEQAD